jgi:Sec-independent protein translocase protein TatA
VPGLFDHPIELLLLAAFAFFVLGPKNFGQTARSAGKAVRELKEAMSLSIQSPSSEPPLLAPDDELRYVGGDTLSEQAVQRPTRSIDDLS